MALTLTYDGILARVRLAATGLASDPVTVQRSTNQVRWVTVRGGASLSPSGGVIRLDDYEFASDVANHYRLLAPGVVGAGQITPALDGVWLKSLARPFLNRKVTVKDYSGVERPARVGVFEVVGRSMPVAISDVRGSRRWTMEVLTHTPAEARDLDLVMASGDPIFVHVPADCDVPGGYVSIDTVTVSRRARRTPRRVFELPCVEVAAPGPDIVGATVTVQTVLATYATCADVLAAHPTCQDLLELIGDPTDVIVP